MHVRDLRGQLLLQALELRVHGALCERLRSPCRSLHQLRLRHQCMQLLERAHELANALQQLLRLDLLFL